MAITQKTLVPMTVSVECPTHARFDRHGVLLEEEVAVPFPEIRLTINLTTPSTDLQVERVKADLGKFCPVSRVIRQSGTRLEEIWNVTRT